MADLLRTERTYATRKGAVKALARALNGATGKMSEEAVLANARWLIAVKEDGRFAPVLVGAGYIGYASMGVTVVG